jgi:hypothetical protein
MGEWRWQDGTDRGVLMKFLENLSEFTGGARGGFGALGEVLAAAAMGEANARPGDRTGAGAARGFAVGVGGLQDAFARGRGMRDKERVRSMAMTKLEDPNLGPAERDLYTAIASGNTAALDLFDETLAARSSDRADRAEQAKLNYYEGKLRGLTAPKAPTAEQMTQHREIMALRRQFIERPEAFADIDLQNPDNDLVRSRQISPVGQDPLGELYLEWSGLDPLMKDRVAFQDMVKNRYGQEGLSLLASDYGVNASEFNPPETGGDVADVAQNPTGGPADAIVDTISGLGDAISGPSNAPSFFDTEYGGLFNSIFGTNYQGRQSRQTRMQGLLGELESAALGQDSTAPAANSPLIPDDQIDSEFQAITRPDLMRREDELRRTTGPQSRFDQFISQMYPSTTPEQSMMQNPTLPIRAGMEFDAAVREIPGQLRGGMSDLRNAMSRVPGDLMQGFRRAGEGDYGPVEVDAYGAGVKAREDFQRAMDPITRRLQPYSDLSPTDQQERERFLRSLGWSG